MCEIREQNGNEEVKEMKAWASHMASRDDEKKFDQNGYEFVLEQTTLYGSIGDI